MSKSTSIRKQGQSTNIRGESLVDVPAERETREARATYFLLATLLPFLRVTLTLRDFRFSSASLKHSTTMGNLIPHLLRSLKRHVTLDAFYLFPPFQLRRSSKSVEFKKLCSRTLLWTQTDEDLGTFFTIMLRYDEYNDYFHRYSRHRAQIVEDLMNATNSYRSLKIRVTKQGQELESYQTKVS